MTDGWSRGTSAPNPFQIRPAGLPFVVGLTDTRCKRAAQSARTRLKIRRIVTATRTRGSSLRRVAHAHAGAAEQDRSVRPSGRAEGGDCATPPHSPLYRASRPRGRGVTGAARPGLHPRHNAAGPAPRAHEGHTHRI